MSCSTLSIRQASVQDLPALYEVIHTLKREKETGYFERSLELQDKQERWLLVGGLSGGGVAGYCILNWQPKYGLYKRLGISEIQDLNIAPDYRRQGYASAMIAYCEQQARSRRHSDIGISVSVHSSFGPAQILYHQLGFAPDGQGATYDRNAVNFADMRPVDDQLCMMLIKAL